MQKTYRQNPNLVDVEYYIYMNMFSCLTRFHAYLLAGKARKRKRSENEGEDEAEDEGGEEGDAPEESEEDGDASGPAPADE